MLIPSTFSLVNHVQMLTPYSNIYLYISYLCKIFNYDIFYSIARFGTQNSNISYAKLNRQGPSLMTLWSKALPLIARCPSPLTRYESKQGYVRRLPVARGLVVVFAVYSDFIYNLQVKWLVTN